jgi:hypothetical protein
VTEAEWLGGTDPLPMLAFLPGRTSARKLRLFAVAAYRLLLAWITDPNSHTAIDVAERYADHLPSRGDLAVAYETAYDVYLNSFDNAIFAYAVADSDASHAATIAVQDGAGIRSGRELAGLLREVVANPFRPPSPPDRSVLSWNDGTVRRLAERIYEERHLPAATLDRECLAILADALQDAGVSDAALLDHLRQPGPHVRGCWALDLVLGKS